MTDHLRRHLAPISAAAWKVIDAEASRTLRQFLGLRPLVDFEGPLGWDHAAHRLGRTGVVSHDGVDRAVRRVQPLVELRTPFTLARDEVDAVDRGAADPDLAQLVDAARRAAAAEDRLIVEGHESAGIRGIALAAPGEALTIGDDFDEYPRIVARAVARLRTDGVGGPYGLALGSRGYTGVVETTERGGYPLLEHLKLIVGGPVIWGPAVEGAVVVSLRGGDYRLVCGQDLSIGYAAHDQTKIELYIEESVTFQVVEPRAAVVLVHAQERVTAGKDRRTLQGVLRRATG